MVAPPSTLSRIQLAAAPASCRYPLTRFSRFARSTQSSWAQLPTSSCPRRPANHATNGSDHPPDKLERLWRCRPLDDQHTITCMPVLVPSDMESKIIYLPARDKKLLRINLAAPASYRYTLTILSKSPSWSQPHRP
jgi:hypothetical protein